MWHNPPFTTGLWHDMTRKISRSSAIVAEHTAPFAGCNGLITSSFHIQASAYHSMQSHLSGNFVRRSSCRLPAGCADPAVTRSLPMNLSPRYLRRQAADMSADRIRSGMVECSFCAAAPIPESIAQAQTVSVHSAFRPPAGQVLSVVVSLVPALPGMKDLHPCPHATPEEVKVRRIDR